MGMMGGVGILLRVLYCGSLFDLGPTRSHDWRDTAALSIDSGPSIPQFAVTFTVCGFELSKRKSTVKIVNLQSCIICTLLRKCYIRGVGEQSDLCLDYTGFLEAAVPFGTLGSYRAYIHIRVYTHTHTHIYICIHV